MLLVLATALISFFALSQSSPTRTTNTPAATQEEVQKSESAERWRELAKPPNFFHEMALLQSLGQDPQNRAAVLNRLHEMWTSYDVLRRPAIAYLMCQLGDRSGVDPVARALFAGDYDTGRELEPEGGAAGANATDDALRMLILYGTPKHHRRLLAFFTLSDDPLRKRGNLCEVLLGLSSTDEGPGLPAGYPKEHFPFELVMTCLNYTEEVETIVPAPGGKIERDRDSITVYGAVGWYPQRGCDVAAQTIQNLTSLDFGHRVSDPVSQRDKAIEAIKKWWSESHPATQRHVTSPD